MEVTMADKKQRQKLASVDQDLRMETELEADPMLTLSEGRASKPQSWRRSRGHRDHRYSGVGHQPALEADGACLPRTIECCLPG
jgi:hypothetical protein